MAAKTARNKQTMADFGFWELALIMLVALVVFGPERLPKLAVQAGEFIGKLKRLAQGFKEDIADAADGEVRNTIAQQRDLLRQTGADINKRLRDLDPLANSMEEQLAKGRFAEAGPDATMNEIAPEADSEQDSERSDQQTAGPADKSTDKA